jgi:hypothetical protein
MKQQQKELKLISAGTTVRNPDRLINFFKSLLRVIEGKIYSKDIQHDIQTVLIQTRDYGYGSKQFYSTLDRKHIELLDSNHPISFDEAKEIYRKKMESYKIKDGIRGRTSISSLNKFGFFYTKIGNKIIASEIGKKYLNKEISETLFFQKVLLKWQFGNNTDDEYKNDDGYNIKPFVAFLHLISKLNKKLKENGKKPIGVSTLEFDLFIPTLINYEDIPNFVENIIDFREKYSSKKSISDKNKFISEFYKKLIYKFNISDKNKKKFINNLSEYGQNNLLLYYLKTDLIELRGANNYIDIKRDLDGNYINAVNEICEKISPEVENFTSPIVEFKNFSKEIEPPLSFLNLETKQYEAKKVNLYLKNKGIKNLRILDDFDGNIDRYNEYLDQKINENKIESFENRVWTVSDVQNSIIGFSNIRSFTDGIKWIEYERLSYWSILQLNDHKLIKPNFPINEEGYPKKKGPPGIPDIECFYENFSLILEVTLKTDHNQWMDETASIMEHLEEFIERSETKDNFCLFISPSIHDRAAKAYFQANKNGFGSDKKLAIIPLKHTQFCKILNVQSELFKVKKKINSSRMLKFYKDIHLEANAIDNYIDWIGKIDSSLNSLISEYLI